MAQHNNFLPFATICHTTQCAKIWQHWVLWTNDSVRSAAGPCTGPSLCKYTVSACLRMRESLVRQCPHQRNLCRKRSLKYFKKMIILLLIISLHDTTVSLTTNFRSRGNCLKSTPYFRQSQTSPRLGTLSLSGPTHGIILLHLCHLSEHILILTPGKKDKRKPQ